MIENPMKGKRGHVCGIPLVCPLVSPGFTKQTGNGRVRLSLVRPSSGTPCARTYVCAANMRMRRGRYASSRERCLRTYACMSMRWQNTRRSTCADNVEHLVFVLASLGCSRSRSRSRCRGTCTRRRADGRFSMRAHVHII